MNLFGYLLNAAVMGLAAQMGQARLPAPAPAPAPAAPVRHPRKGVGLADAYLYHGPGDVLTELPARPGPAAVASSPAATVAAPAPSRRREPPQPPDAPRVSYLPALRVRGREASEWLAAYGREAWTVQDEAVSTHGRDRLRAAVLQAVGPQSANGLALASRFRSIGRQMRQLHHAFRAALREHPRHQDEVREVAGTVRDELLLRLSQDQPTGSAVAVYRSRLEARLAAAPAGSGEPGRPERPPAFRAPA